MRIRKDGVSRMRWTLMWLAQTQILFTRVLPATINRVHRLLSRYRPIHRLYHPSVLVRLPH